MGASLSWSLAVEMSAPQETTELGRPMPMKDREASDTMKVPSATVAYTMMGAIELGMMWLIRMRPREAPVARAAVTNSSFLALMTEPRVIRAMDVHAKVDRTMTTMAMERDSLNICMKTMAARSSGIAKKTSVIRERRASIQPPT